LASDLKQAGDLCSEEWFITKLASYRSLGLPVWNGITELRLRIANSVEATEVQIAPVSELMRGESEGHIFAFRLPIDALCQQWMRGE